jgi:hypothetical protein
MVVPGAEDFATIPLLRPLQGSIRPRVVMAEDEPGLR